MQQKVEKKMKRRKLVVVLAVILLGSIVVNIKDYSKKEAYKKEIQSCKEELDKASIDAEDLAYAYIVGLNNMTITLYYSEGAISEEIYVEYNNLMESVINDLNHENVKDILRLQFDTLNQCFGTK